jgi:hypothetical protein
MIEDGAPGVTPKNEADARAMRKLLALQRAGAIRLMVTRSTAMEKQPPGRPLDEQALQARLVQMGLDPEDIFTHPRSMPFSTPGEPNTVTWDPNLELGLHQAVHEILFQGRGEGRGQADAKNVDFRWHPYRNQECEREYKRHGIGCIDMQAFVELDGLRWRTGNLPPPPTPALDARSPQQREVIDDILTRVHDEWLNTKCDAEGLYVHASHAVYTTVPHQAVFVTSDKNFKRFSLVLKKTNWERLQALGFPGHIMTPDEAVAYFERVSGMSPPDTN